MLRDLLLDCVSLGIVGSQLSSMSIKLVTRDGKSIAVNKACLALASQPFRYLISKAQSDTIHLTDQYEPLRLICDVLEGKPFTAELSIDCLRAAAEASHRYMLHVVLYTILARLQYVCVCLFTSCSLILILGQLHASGRKRQAPCIPHR